MSLDLQSMRQTFASYRGASLTARAFVAARLLVAPLVPLAEEFASISGRVLSLGSGISAVERYLANTNTDLIIDGVDLNAGHVDLVAATAARCPRVSLRLGDATTLDAGPVYDAVLVCDLLHHIPASEHKRLAEAIASALRPGGVCIVKDLDVTPRWKHEWNRLHDRLVAGPEPVFCQPPEHTAELLAAAGLETERAERTDRALTPYAHYLVRARKPQATGDATAQGDCSPPATPDRA